MEAVDIQKRTDLIASCRCFRITLRLLLLMMMVVVVVIVVQVVTRGSVIVVVVVVVVTTTATTAATVTVLVLTTPTIPDGSFQRRIVDVVGSQVLDVSGRIVGLFRRRRHRHWYRRTRTGCRRRFAIRIRRTGRRMTSAAATDGRSLGQSGGCEFVVTGRHRRRFIHRQNGGRVAAGTDASAAAAASVAALVVDVGAVGRLRPVLDSGRTDRPGSGSSARNERQGQVTDFDRQTTKQTGTGARQLAEEQMGRTARPDQRMLLLLLLLAEALVVMDCGRHRRRRFVIGWRQLFRMTPPGATAARHGVSYSRTRLGFRAQIRKRNQQNRHRKKNGRTLTIITK